MALLEVKNLKVYFPVRGALQLPWRKREVLKAVDDLSFSLEPGEIVGLVGESGCGKSTVARALVRLEKTEPGSEIRLAGENICALHGKKLRSARKNFQMVFQDPYGSLNPRMTIFAALDEVLALHSTLKRAEREARAGELLEMVGLKREFLERYPHEFSGGQRQRIGIARALAAEPRLLIADEPVSALDVSVQASIINLLEDIRQKTRTALLFIAHDLGVVEHISDRILVMYLGRIVESGNAREICENPRHPYTKALLSSVPTVAKKVTNRILLEGDVPSPLNPPSGCAFHPRCPLARAACRTQMPQLQEIGSGHWSRCLFPEEVIAMTGTSLPVEAERNSKD